MEIKYPNNKSRTIEYFKNFENDMWGSSVLKKLICIDNPVIFDVGANIGNSLDAYKKIWGNSIVHCFEPQIECFDVLEKKAIEYGNTFIIKHAVGSETINDVDFYTHDINIGLSGVNKINLNSKDSIVLNDDTEYRDLFLNGITFEEYKTMLNKKRSVSMIRLDKYIDDNNIKKVDFIKIDTQGHEIEVLCGLNNNLKNVHIILAELNFYDLYEKSFSFYDLESILHPMGFKLYDISYISKNPMNGRTDWVDVIYVNSTFGD